MSNFSNPQNHSFVPARPGSNFCLICGRSLAAHSLLTKKYDKGYDTPDLTIRAVDLSMKEDIYKDPESHSPVPDGPGSHTCKICGRGLAAHHLLKSKDGVTVAASESVLDKEELQERERVKLRKRARRYKSKSIDHVRHKKKNHRVRSCNKCQTDGITECFCETTMSSAAPAGLPQVALGGRPSDAYKRPKMKLRKIREAEDDESTKPKLGIKAKPRRSVEFDTNWTYGKPYEALPKRTFPKIRVVRLKEDRGICACNHDFEDHNGHNCIKCDGDDKHHKFQINRDLKMSAFVDKRKDKQNLMADDPFSVTRWNS